MLEALGGIPSLANIYLIVHCPSSLFQHSVCRSLSCDCSLAFKFVSTFSLLLLSYCPAARLRFGPICHQLARKPDTSHTSHMAHHGQDLALSSDWKENVAPAVVLVAQEVAGADAGESTAADGPQPPATPKQEPKEQTDLADGHESKAGGAAAKDDVAVTPTPAARADKEGHPGSGASTVRRFIQRSGGPAAALRKYIASFSDAAGEGCELGRQPPCRSYRSLRILQELGDEIAEKLNHVQHKDSWQWQFG